MQEKILDLGWFVLLPPTYSPDLAPSDFHFFVLFKMFWMKKISLEDQVKVFVENFLSLKPAEFYLRGINNLLDKWQEVIENNDEYIIDWNKFIVKLFMNE